MQKRPGGKPLPSTGYNQGTLPPPTLGGQGTLPAFNQGTQNLLPLNQGMKTGFNRGTTRTTNYRHLTATGSGQNTVFVLFFGDFDASCLLEFADFLGCEKDGCTQ